MFISLLWLGYRKVLSDLSGWGYQQSQSFPLVLWEGALLQWSIEAYEASGPLAVPAVW